MTPSSAPASLAGDIVEMLDVRLVSKGGLSNPRAFMVGALDEVNEAEPNNDFVQPQKVPMDCTITGVADNEDVDYYLVEAKKGERITAEIEGIRLGVTFFELVTGKVPFPEGDVTFHHRHSAPPDPRAQAETLPDAFAELIAELLAKQPEARPESANAVAARLQAIADSLS